MSELEKSLEERSKIPIPSGDAARVKLLAQDMALGVHKDLWQGYHIAMEKLLNFLGVTR